MGKVYIPIFILPFIEKFIFGGGKNENEKRNKYFYNDAGVQKRF